MRLIDAGALADELAVLLEKNTKLIDEWLANLIEDAVDDAPTVDTVPLEDYKSLEQTVNKLTKALADAEPVRHGHWEWDGDFICSNCGERGHRNKWNYCPNCGAKMDEERKKWLTKNT